MKITKGNIMLNEIYTQLYSETEQGKRSWREVSRRNAELLRKISGEGIDQCRLEDALTAAGEAGTELFPSSFKHP